MVIVHHVSLDMIFKDLYALNLKSQRKTLSVEHLKTHYVSNVHKDTSKVELMVDVRK